MVYIFLVLSSHLLHFQSDCIEKENRNWAKLSVVETLVNFEGLLN